MEVDHLDKDDTSVEDKLNDDLDDINGILKDLDNATKNEETTFVSPNDAESDQPLKHVEEEILKRPDEEFNKVSESSDLSRPPGFENTKRSFSNNSKCSTNFARHHKKDIKESKMTRLELFHLKSIWGNNNFDYACSMSRGRSGGLLSMWDPNIFSKEAIWCDDHFIIVKGHWNNEVGDCFMINIYGSQESSAKSSLWNHLAEFMNHHNGKFILFGDLNTVRHENERSGSLFSRIEAEHFNSFIDSIGFIDLPIGGRCFTWMNKAGTKLSKLDRFLISERIAEDIPEIKVTAIDRMWSDHSPILLNIKKDDFGPSLFKFYNTWLNRDGFDDIIKSTWASMDTGNGNNNISSHVQLKGLKTAIKKWQVDVRNNDRSQKHATLFEIKDIEKKIDDGSASNSDREKRIKLLQDIDKLDNLEALDLIQKARIKWDIEGDVMEKWREILVLVGRRGVWSVIWYKDKFQAHDSQVVFSLITNSSTLCHLDRDFLESHISLEEVKKAVCECGSNKAHGILMPPGYYATDKVHASFLYAYSEDQRTSTLIKAVLGSLGIYYLSIFKAPETILNSLESLRSRFFWVVPKILRTWRGFHGLKFSLLSKKKRLEHRRYMVKKVVWTIMVVTLMALGLGLLVLLTFCTRKIGDSPLLTRYNRLYRLDQDKDCLIIDRIVNGQWHWNWSRADIGTRNTAYLRDLLMKISQIDLSMGDDTCTWSLADDGLFSVRSSRRLIDSKLLPSIQTSTL
ncbi:RNA-directed DNA polymerase, eukaryota, reverse transcriptase zinc-binding domain protein [Tanacetum coccineum]